MSIEAARRAAAWLGLSLLLPLTAEGKRVETPYSSPSAVADALVGKVQGTVSRDAARLLRQFRQLHEGTQTGRVEAALAGALGIELSILGFGVEIGIDGTEMVGILRNGPGPTLLYRVDTGADILGPAPTEHRCGADVQAAWALGLARALTQLRAEWAGTVVVAAQPSRLITRGGPNLRGAGQLDPSRWPRPDFSIAVLAAGSPIGSVLRVQGLRQAGSEAVDVAISRTGIYAEEPNIEASTDLAAATTRAYGSSEDVPFAYLLVGISAASPAAPAAGGTPAPLDANVSPEESLRVDLGALSLGAKIAAVAVLELLRPAPRLEAKKGNSLGWTPHNY